MRVKEDFTGCVPSDKVTDLGNGILKNERSSKARILIGIPATGLVRIEWATARYGQVIPCNWSNADMVIPVEQYSPLGFLVADARNLVATKAVESDVEWLLFIDHDVIIPPHTFLVMNQYMLAKKYPVVSGLYWTKSVPSEPLIYRGYGTSYYQDWKLGDKVPVDGVPMGCTLISVSILKEMYKDSEEYFQGPNKVRRIFKTPAKVESDGFSWWTNTGTEDLHWCSEVIEKGYLKRAGWKDLAKKKYPFLLDTGLYCRHIDNSGIQYPANGEDSKHMRSGNGRP